MKKTGMILIFIFLTGLFSGLFFSTNLSSDSNDTLSSLLLAGFTSSEAGFFKTFTTVLLSNILLFILMLPALFTKYLKPLPLLILWYKSFALGFCSGLIHLNAPTDALRITLLKLFPQNLFFIPAFIVFSATVFIHSERKGSSSHRHAPAVPFRHSSKKKSRLMKEFNSLPYILAASAILLILGSLTEAVFHLIAL